MNAKEKAALYEKLSISFTRRIEEERLAGEAVADTLVHMLHREADEGLPCAFWCGIYRVASGDAGERRLELWVATSPACSPLPVVVRTGGVCSDCVLLEKPIVVPDVSFYPGHVFCDHRARSEVVIPLFDLSDRLAAVLDVDSKSPGSFDHVDVEWLMRLVQPLRPFLLNHC